MELNATERDILTQLQCGIAITESPFAGYAIAEAEVVGLLQRAKESGWVRRFGGVFDSHRLGYKSMLCAIDAAPDIIDEMAAIICQHSGVTHCYERKPLAGGQQYPSLWFTIAMQAERFDQGIRALQAQLPASLAIQRLPALQRFKIDVVFDLCGGHQQRPMGILPDGFGAGDAVQLTEADRKIVSVLAGALPIVAQPFDKLAQDAGLDVYAFLVRLRQWQQQGVLRRIAPILHHRAAGFRANGMCVWPVSGDVGAFGQRLAARPEVTHCYQRPRLPGFAFDLFAMIHTGSEAQLRQMFGEISAACGLQDGTVLLSTREFKKSSLPYFASEEAAGA